MSKRVTLKEVIKTKLDLVEIARADSTVTDSDYRLYSTLLLQFHCNELGICNPSDGTLGRAAGGKCERTAWAGTNDLQAKGCLAKIRTRGASLYIFPGLPLPQKLAGDGRVTSATSCENFRKIVSELPHTACGTEPFIEPRREASPAPLKRVEASRKKANGQHRNGEEKTVRKSEAEREADVAKWEAVKKQTLTPEGRQVFRAAGVRVDKFKFPSREPRYKATERDRIANQYIARGEKPPPTVLAPGRLDNVSSFPNATAKKPWTRPTISEGDRAEATA